MVRDNWLAKFYLSVQDVTFRGQLTVERRRLEGWGQHERRGLAQWWSRTSSAVPGSSTRSLWTGSCQRGNWWILGRREDPAECCCTSLGTAAQNGWGKEKQFMSSLGKCTIYCRGKKPYLFSCACCLALSCLWLPPWEPGLPCPGLCWGVPPGSGKHSNFEQAFEQHEIQAY